MSYVRAVENQGYQIAERLQISARTAQSHISNLLVKLGVRSRVEAVLQLYQWRQA